MTCTKPIGYLCIDRYIFSEIVRIADGLTPRLTFIIYAIIVRFGLLNHKERGCKHPLRLYIIFAP